ncbi:MAG: hypothetical protein KAI26_04385 [Nanoarchaeota archaeon]|nr:hypothetical protein [Nanoarchaeota archaeon]
MAYKKPESMDECVYFSNRDVGAGSAMVWVFKQECPKCHKALMGKPVDAKTGRAKIRAKEYVCPGCSYSVEKEEYEEGLTAYCEYTCPECKEHGEAETPYKRKSIDGVKTLRFNCQSCSANIDITKKMKEKKKKK